MNIKNKILKDAGAASAQVDQWKKAGKTVVFTNGCFDILHAGHVLYLEAAKNIGDVLMLGLNSDASIKRLKGALRPINAEKERAVVLAALSSVDAVVTFEEDTPMELINALIPNVLVKGGDYDIDDIIGKDVVEANGGKVVTIDYIPGESTTDKINKLANKE